MSLIDPILTVVIEEPFIPQTRQLVMGWSDMKSLRSGEMWVVQLLLRRKGKDIREDSRRREDGILGATEMADRSTEWNFSVQSTKALSSFWRSSQAST